MAIEVIMPRVDMDMTEGKIAFWYVKNGDKVTKGQTLFDIETDKATMEVDAEADGVIDGIRGEIGVPVPVGQPVAWLLAEGEALPGAPAAGQAAPVDAAGAGPVEAEDLALAAAETARVLATAGHAGGVLRASPRARHEARRQGIDLRSVVGRGPGGAVQARDLPAHAAPAAPGLNLQWLAQGEGPPLVLLHGFGADLGSWRPLAQTLRGVPSIGVDLPNHGKSPRISVRTFDDIARRVHERIVAEDLTSVHVVGHSMGGAVAAALAPLLGDRLRSLTLIAPAGLGPHINGDFIDALCRVRSEAALRAWLRLLVHDEQVLSGSFVATAWQQLSVEGRQQSLLEMARALLPDGTQIEDLRPRLQSLRVPLKVLWGTADRILPVHHADALPAMAALHRLPGIGHLPQVEAIDSTVALLRQQIAAAR